MIVPARNFLSLLKINNFKTYENIYYNNMLFLKKILLVFVNYYIFFQNKEKNFKKKSIVILEVSTIINYTT